MKVNHYLFAIIISFFFVTNVWSSNKKEPIVATVGGAPIFKSEFENAYNKNFQTNKNKQLSPKEFLEDYINYKLIIQEAINKGFANKSNFQNEYSEYINDLKRPYIEDSVSNIHWIKDIYNRLKNNIEITDIFIPYSAAEYFFPQDTLKAYQLAKSIRNKIKDDGSNFEEVAQEYSIADSTGKSIAVSGHKRWITSLLTNLDYEDAVYNMKINQVSDPIRSQMGYSIVKVLAQRPDEGSIRLSAIQLIYPENATTNQIDSVNSLGNKLYNALRSGINFDSLYMQYSLNPDIESIGDIGYWSIRRPLNQISSNIIKSLNVGDYSPPFVVGNKVNILKITDRRSIPAFENFQHDIIDRLKYFDYINNFKVMENKAIGKEISYKINFDTYNQLLEISSLTSICDSLFIKQIKHLEKNEIVSIDNKKYNIKDFLIYFSNNKKSICSIYKLTTDALYYGLNSFIYDRLLALKDQQLLDNNPQLKSIANEFYNGLLYFDIMSDMVWDKAQNDNVNLEQYYFDNQDKYKWTEPRYEGYLIFTKNKDLMQKAKQIIENNKENISVALKDSLNKNKEINIIVDKRFWSKGENEYIDELLYNIPTSRAMIGYPYYFFEGIKIEQPRNVNDVRGSVIADYQAILENEWIESLRQKSSITINENVLKSISNKSIIN